MNKWMLIILISFMTSSVFAQGGWMTDQTNQCQVWDPNPTPHQSLTWTGECKNGKANSQGIAEWHEAGRVVTSIEGVMQDGRCQGQCLVYITSGKNKFKYSGQLKDNNLEGKGALTWPNGNKYSGNWVKGERHGKGTFIWKNGTTYTGDWKNDKSTGRGTYTWVDRYEKKYTGEVKDGKFHGSGVMLYATDDKYSGSWVNGKRHGKGIYTFNDGTIYKGIWENGTRIQLFPRLRNFFFW